jgi:hypothetical protein
MLVDRGGGGGGGGGDSTADSHVMAVEFLFAGEKIVRR